MRYKVGDIARVRSLSWYNENKDKRGAIHTGSDYIFLKGMEVYCGRYATIIDVEDGGYRINIDNNDYYLTDEMLED